MKSVLTSIQPYYVFLIIARIMGWNIPQKKTVEVRKDFPKATDWDKRTIIYCTKSKRSFKLIPKEYQPFMTPFLGKVVGEFVCERISKYPFDWATFTAYGTELFEIKESELNRTCLSRDEFNRYGADSNRYKGYLYGWHISELKIYDKPKELSEFRKPCDRFLDCFLCRRYKRDEFGGCDSKIHHPPQSWCYIGEL